MKNEILAILAIVCITMASCNTQTVNITKETVVCDTGENNCSVTCASGCCLAIYWPDTNECSKSCDCDKLRNIKKSTAIDKNAKITIVAKNVKLSQIAAALDNIKGYQILVPANKMATPVSISIKNVSLSRALKSLNLHLSKQK